MMSRNNIIGSIGNIYGQYYHTRGKNVDTIPVARPAIGQEEISAVTAVLQSGMLASGERVVEFEKKFADYCGTTHGCHQ
jgi:hypothetical protein